MGNKAVNILLVEDDEIDVMNVQRAFRKINMNNSLFVARNGEEALKMLRSDLIAPPRVVLLDLNMPKMGGIEFLAEIRNDHSLAHLSVVVMTTSNEEKDKLEAYRLNVAGYMLKPISQQQFIHSISVLNNYWNLCQYPESN